MQRYLPLTVRAILSVGLRNAWRQFMILKEVREGVLVGTDVVGNEYWENTFSAVQLRSRWVMPANHLKYSPTEIPPEWHAWLHRTVDLKPAEREIPQYEWLLPTLPSQTGTRGAYKPYSTVPPAIATWTPKPFGRE